MFAVIRDSIFRPRSLPKYRNKSGLFVFFYVLILSILFCLSGMVPYINNRGLDSLDKERIIETFSSSDAKITDSIFSSSESYMLSLQGQYFAFLADDENISTFLNKTSENIDYVIYKDSIYRILNAYTKFVLKTDTIKELSSRIEHKDGMDNVILSSLTPDSDFLLAFNEMISEYNKFYFVEYTLNNFVTSLIIILVYPLIMYMFIMIFMKASRYMKKSQLYKLLIFSSTLILIVRAFLLMIHLGYFELIFVLISFIPMFILQKDIVVRIRLAQISQYMENNKNDDNFKGE